MTRHEDFYDDEPWPGPDEHSWTLGPAFQAFAKAFGGLPTQGDFVLVSGRAFGKSAHNPHENHVHVRIGTSIHEAMEAAAKMNQQISQLGIAAVDVNMPRLPTNPPHSMTQRYGFRRGRKTT